MGFPEGEPGTDLMSYEKLSPILALWAYEEPFDTAIKIVEKLISCSGRGHSCAIHTRARDRVYHLADNIKVGRVMVNQSTSFGNAGSFYNGMPFSSTLSCGTWAGSVTTENINWRHYMNYTRVSEAINGAHPNPEKFFADHWDKYGR
jgi:sulfoacetaldehyde dehydrogenase